MKKLKITLFLITALSSSEVSAQVNRSITFDSCFVYGREHPDSVFRASALFKGFGNFDFYRDSIVVTFSNEWESGKYLIELEDLEGEISGDDFIWYYQGHEKYRGWAMICMLVVDAYDQPLYLEMFSNYTETEETSFANTTRVYNILDN